jgi:hypothetical protein
MELRNPPHSRGKNLFGNRSLNGLSKIDLEKQVADHRAAQHGSDPRFSRAWRGFTNFLIPAIGSRPQERNTNGEICQEEENCPARVYES